MMSNNNFKTNNSSSSLPSPLVVVVDEQQSHTATTGVAQRQPHRHLTDESSGAVPRWKLEFLAKKKALAVHQQRKLEERTLGKSRGDVQQQHPTPPITTTRKEEAIVIASSNNNNGRTEQQGGGSNNYSSSMSHRNYNTVVCSGSAQQRSFSNTAVAKHSAERNNGADNRNDSSSAQQNNGGAQSLNSNQFTTLNCLVEMEDNKMVDSEASAVSTDSSSVEEDDLTSNNNSLRKKKGKAGGYSFLTGKRLNGEDSEVSSEESESVETESETEGSTELKYRPGFVSKLLNKFSTISYQGQPVTTTSSSSLPYSTASHNKSHNSLPASTKQVSRPALLSPLHSPKSPTAIGDMIDLTSSSAKVPTHTRSVPALTTLTSRPATVRSTSIVELQKTPSYRAPDEIILIEGVHDSKAHESAESTGTVETLLPLAESLPSSRLGNSEKNGSVQEPPDVGSTSAAAAGYKPAESIRERVQLAKATFEKPLKPTSPVTPSSPRAAINEPNRPSVTAKLVKSPEIVIISREEITGSAGGGEETAKTSPAEETSLPWVKSVKKMRFSPPAPPAEPLFTLIKLKPTKHRLYQLNPDEGQTTSPAVTSQTERFDSSKPKYRERARVANEQSVTVHQEAVADHASKADMAIASSTLDTSSSVAAVSSPGMVPSRSVPPRPLANHITPLRPLADHIAPLGALAQKKPTDLHIEETPSDSLHSSSCTANDRNVPSNHKSSQSISLSGVPVRSPCADITSSPVDVIAPTADVIAPTEDVIAPTVDVIAPTVDVITPTGDIITPTAVTAPMVAVIAPTGNVITPSADLIAPNADVIAPSSHAESLYPSGGATSVQSTPVVMQTTVADINPTNQHVTPSTAISADTQQSADPVHKPNNADVSKSSADVSKVSADASKVSAGVSKVSAGVNKVSAANVGSASGYQSTNQSPSKKVKSLDDIPGPSNKPAATSVNSGETDLEAALRKRKEKASANELPVTNIDEMIAAPRKGSGTVLDTRKTMGAKRKVPEYEKIHDGPKLSFIDTTVVVRNGCLKVPSGNVMKKNLSFNDLQLSEVHEYPSEKVLIQQIAKEQGAVYWDDPDHLQAAPDRSVDEPEPENTTSSLRSSLKGSPVSTGSLGTHRPSNHSEYIFGQSAAVSEQPSTARQHDMSEDNPSLKIKPAEEHELKSWSSDGTSDILF